MSMLTVRDLDPKVKAKLRERAARHGRSMEADVREVLARSVDEAPPVDFVAALAETFRDYADEIPDFPRLNDPPRAPAL